MPLLSSIDRVIIGGLMEVAPPGMEPVVKKLKKKSGVDNPWAVAWAMHNQSQGRRKRKAKTSVSTGTMAPLLRGEKRKGESNRLREAGDFVEQIIDPSAAATEGNRVKVALISEGLGNRSDMNFYGPESIASAPAVFEGKSCFLDHPGKDDEENLPERHVSDKCGYFKNCRVESLNGRLTCTGELHFDLSESGRLGFDKALTALHYRREFPNSEDEYVGLSVNADGDTMDRSLDVGDETLDVNYVTRFTRAVSCDIVTSPARGGKFLALVESAAGAIMKNKEGRAMIVKSLKAVQTSLLEAQKTEGLSDEAKTKMAEAAKSVEELIKKVNEAAKEGMLYSKKGKAAEEEESEDGEEEGKKNAKSKQSESETEDEDETGEEESEDEKRLAKAGSMMKAMRQTFKQMRAMASEMGLGDDDGDDDDAKDNGSSESQREAIKSLLKEAGLREEIVAGIISLEELAKMPWKEAKTKISGIKKMQESLQKELMEKIGEVPAFFAKGFKESDSNGGGANHNDLFADCAR